MPNLTSPTSFELVLKPLLVFWSEFDASWMNIQWIVGRAITGAGPGDRTARQGRLQAEGRDSFGGGPCGEETHSLMAAAFVPRTDVEAVNDQRPPATRLEDWEGRVGRQNDVWTLVCGAEWKLVRTHSLELLLE